MAWIMLGGSKNVLLFKRARNESAFIETENTAADIDDPQSPTSEWLREPTHEQISRRRT
jgi:hypothetical protein